MLNSYKELKVWQKSIQLVEEIYILTNKFPKDEQHGLSIQMRRAAISIPSNIAEGQRRKDLPEYLQFLRIADSSSAELETQIIIAKKIYPLLNYERVNSLLDEIQKMFNVLIRKLKEKNLKSKTQNLKPNFGYTLIELLVVMGIVVLLATVSITNLSGYRGQQELNLVSREIVTVLRNSQNRSISQESSSQYGVHFDNTDSNSGFFVLFMGPSYSSSSLISKSPLPSNIQFVIPASGASSSAVFSLITGLPSASSSIIISQKTNALSSSTININSNGHISF